MQFSFGDTIVYKPNEENDLYWFAEILEISESGKCLIQFDREIYPTNYMYPQENPRMIVSDLSQLYRIDDIFFRPLLK